MAFHGSRAFLVPIKRLLVTFDTLPGKARIECRRYRIHHGGAPVSQSEFRRGKIVEPGEELVFFVGRGNRLTRKTVINQDGSVVLRES